MMPLDEIDYNLLISCIRDRERNAVMEAEDLIGSTIGDSLVEVALTGVRSLIAARSSLEPRTVIGKLRTLAIDDPWRFQYTLKYVPLDVVVPTEMNRIVEASGGIVHCILEDDTFRITCNKRHSQLHCTDIIKSVAAIIDRKVDLEKPKKVLQVEVVGEWTGLSVLGPSDTLSLCK
ncbi:MAG: THUMP domain-containing protein [Candidatus Atabeyarchaeum deiterrae]